MSIVIDCGFNGGTNGADFSTTGANVGTMVVADVATFYLQSDRAYASNSYSRMRSNQTLPGNYSLKATTRFLGNAGTFDMLQLFLRAASDYSSFYVLNLNRDGTWSLDKRVSGVDSTGLKTGTATIAANTDYTVDFAYNAGTLRWFLGGVQQGTDYVDGSPPATNDRASVAYYGSATPSSTTGWHIDRFVLDDAPTAPAASAAFLGINNGMIY